MAASAEKEVKSRFYVGNCSDMGEGHVTFGWWSEKAQSDGKEWARKYWGMILQAWRSTSPNGLEIGMVWRNSWNSTRLWGCNGTVGHKVRLWPAVFPWLMESISQDLERLNGVLRVTENCQRRGVSKGNVRSVWLCVFFLCFSLLQGSLLIMYRITLFFFLTARGWGRRGEEGIYKSRGREIK